MPNFNFENILTQLKKRNFLIIIAGLVIVFIVFIGLFFNSRQEKPEQSNLLEAGVPSSVSNIVESGVLYNLTGVIKELEDNAIIFEAIIPHFNENNQLITTNETRKAIINSNTALVRLEIIIHKETGAEIPEEKTIEFKDFKVDDYIEVLSLAGQDISRAEEFEVSKIRILPY